MKLSECDIGTIVRTTYNQEERKVGHIVGLTLSDAEQVIPIVRWADGKQAGIQAYNLVTLKDAEMGD